MSIILGVAEGDVFANDAEIQKSALQVSKSAVILKQCIVGHRMWACRCQPYRMVTITFIVLV